MRWQRVCNGNDSTYSHKNKFFFAQVIRINIHLYDEVRAMSHDESTSQEMVLQSWRSKRLLHSYAGPVLSIGKKNRSSQINMGNTLFLFKHNFHSWNNLYTHVGPWSAETKCMLFRNLSHWKILTRHVFKAFVPKSLNVLKNITFLKKHSNMVCLISGLNFILNIYHFINKNLYWFIRITIKSFSFLFLFYIKQVWS